MINCSAINVIKCIVESIRNDTECCYYVRCIDDESIKFTVPLADRMMSKMNLEVNDICYVFFQPHNVYLIKPSNKWLYSSSNCFEGEVKGMTECKENSILSLQVGKSTIIKAKLSNYVKDSMNIVFGDKLDVVIKANQVMLAKEIDE
jgi:molybdopterin-binding protein